MNDEKRKAMLAAANAVIDDHDWYNYPEEFAADFALEQMRPLESRIVELERWRLALESLTPQGSEFANDVDACLAYIEKRRQSDHQMLVKAVCEKRELERQLAVADTAMKEMLRCINNERTQCTNEYFDAVARLAHALAKIRGGATSSTVSTS